MYSIILKDKGVVSILICSKANIMIEISGFILNNPLQKTACGIEAESWLFVF